VLVLDSGAVTALADNPRRAARLIAALRRRDLWPPVVPSVVLAESLTGDDRRRRPRRLLGRPAAAGARGVRRRDAAQRGHVMGVELRDASVVVEGHWDARGTLGVDRETPVGLTDVTVTFAFHTDADGATADRLVSLAERYCVIAQTLRTPPTVQFRRTAAELGPRGRQ
jgi:uncharacterized OsmC-like protein